MIHSQTKGGFMDPNLINNPLLKSMDTKKLQFILNFAQKEKPTNMNAAMPFLMANIKSAKNSNIQFSKQEIQLLVEILSKDLSPSEKTKVNQIMNMLIK